VVLVVVFLLAAACPGEAASYVVQPGDTLWLVAQRYDTSVNAMVQANGLTNPEYIEVGQRLTIPEDVALHVVRPGETLWLIAQQYDTTTDAIARKNGISQPDYIEVGAQLRIPTSGSSSVSHRFSASELDLLARLVHAESAGEPYAGQVAVAATILNRVESLRYPNTISGVIYQVVQGHYQYSPVMDGRINLAANQTARSAAQDALNGWDPSQGAIGFYNPMKATNTWVRQQPVTTAIGNHVFFR
jgi:N-acetylmuramoyl-L-alanine amidase